MKNLRTCIFFAIFVLAFILPFFATNPAMAWSPTDFIDIVSPQLDNLSFYPDTTGKVNITVKYHYSDSATQKAGHITLIWNIWSEGSDGIDVIVDTLQVPETGTAFFSTDLTDPKFQTDRIRYFHSLIYVKEAGWSSTSPNVGIGCSIHYEPPVTSVPTTKPANTKPAVDVGSIYISSNPGNAQIWINGKYQTTTQSSIDNPFGFTDLTPGQYTVVLKKDGYQDYTEVVNVLPNQIYTIKATMKQGTTATGWIQVNTDPIGVTIYLQGKQIAVAPILLTDVAPGNYDITLKKDGYEDWHDTITVTAGQITTVNAELPVSPSGFPVGGVVGGVAAVGVVGGGIALLRGRMRGTAGQTPPVPKDLYQEWWSKATPEQRSNWNSFDDFLSSRMGAPLKGYVNEWGNPSWASAYNSWKKEAGETGSNESFENWARRQSANQQISDSMWARAEANKNFRPKEIVEASDNYARFVRLNKLKDIVAGDKTLSEFTAKAGKAMLKDGVVDAREMARLEGNLKHWIVRDKINQGAPDYTYQDAVFDTARNPIFRIGAAYLTGGYSEMALNPISALGTMRDSIMQGDSTGLAIAKGFGQSAFELGIGETPRVVNFFKGGGAAGEVAENAGKVSSSLENELKAVKNLAKQEGQVTRNAFMKSSESATIGKNASYELSAAEKKALELNNSAEFRGELAKNSSSVPSDIKETMGVAKQKVFQNARNNAVDDVMKQMEKDGINTADKTFMINQTGSHAQPGNPAWNSLKSDFDHTVNFGEAKYNQLYEQRLNTHLESQGTSAKAMDVNVYGEGTSSHGAYEGGAKKFVEHYNETTGSDIMVRNVKGTTNITYETPQTSSSLLGKMNQGDVASAHTNYQNFFNKDISKATDLNSQIVNGAKTVSRDAGKNGIQSVKNFLDTGKVNYQPPPAAQVADRIKNFGETPQVAMQKVGYNGSLQQLFNDFKNILGVK